MSYCERCNGTGKVKWFAPGMDEGGLEPCPDCKKGRKMKAKEAPSCKHCDDTGLVAWEAGDKQSIDPCECLLRNGINIPLRGGEVKLSFVEGGGVILRASSNSKPPDILKFIVERADLKKLIKALKRGRGIMRALGQK